MFLKVGLAVTLAATAVMLPLGQVDVIPEAVWVQYPLVLIFAGTAVWVAKYWLQNDREWRKDFIQMMTTKDEQHRQELQHLIDETLERQIDIITKIYYSDQPRK